MAGQVRPIILSHKRAGRVTTHLRVANCELSVEQSQVPAYRAAYPDLPLLVHPDDLGPAKTRQWVLEQGGDQIHLDDDMLGIYRVYRRPGSWKRAVLSPQRAYELIQMTADTARQMGAFLYGFGKHAHPLTFNGLRPFRMGGYSPGGAMGLLEGSKLYFPTDHDNLPLEDYWICLLNAYHHRFAFYDFRFSCGFADTYVNPGGMAEFRSTKDGKEPEVAATEYLRKHFGQAIRDSRYTQRNVTRRNRNPGRRQIVMPYQT